MLETLLFHQMFHRFRALDVLEGRYWTFETFLVRKVEIRNSPPFTESFMMKGHTFEMKVE